MGKFIDLTGQMYGRLRVIRLSFARAADGRLLWTCECVCGNLCDVRSGGLRSGNTLSCGCWNTEAFATRITLHGKANTGAHRSWGKMMQRCGNPNDTHYANYGGRGITVCDRWLKFENFYADMGDRPVGMSIDRIDNNKGYSPENCRWATKSEQQNNTRNNRLITYNNETLNVSQWSVRMGWDASVLRTRLRRSWTIEEALTTPVGQRRTSKQNVVSGVNDGH